MGGTKQTMQLLKFNKENKILVEIISTSQIVGGKNTYDSKEKCDNCFKMEQKVHSIQ